MRSNSQLDCVNTAYGVKVRERKKERQNKIMMTLTRRTFFLLIFYFTNQICILVEIRKKQQCEHHVDESQ